MANESEPDLPSVPMCIYACKVNHIVGKLNVSKPALKSVKREVTDDEWVEALCVLLEIEVKSKLLNSATSMVATNSNQT